MGEGQQAAGGGQAMPGHRNSMRVILRLLAACVLEVLAGSQLAWCPCSNVVVPAGARPACALGCAAQPPGGCGTHSSKLT
jgi:hypothetical protein